MDLVTRAFQQLRNVWNEGSRNFRIALVVSLVASVLTVIGVGRWASRPQYIPLANNISLDEAARVIEQLEANNIPYEKSFSMSTILVPEAYWNDARIAARDVIGDTETTDWTASSGSPFDDPQQKELRMVRGKESAIAATIRQINGVESADVHLAIPRQTAFCA